MYIVHIHSLCRVGDPLCDGCKDMWTNVLKSIVSDYTSKQKIFFSYRLLPLPYHRNAFPISQAAFTIEKLAPGHFHDYLEMIYSVQDTFGNGPTSNMTTNQVVDMMANLAIKIPGVTKAYVHE